MRRAERFILILLTGREKSSHEITEPDNLRGSDSVRENLYTITVFHLAQAHLNNLNMEDPVVFSAYLPFINLLYHHLCDSAVM